MSLAGLILRSIQYHWRLHLGLLAGVVIACAALTGALAVGHSVERTLYEIAATRLGRISHALDWGPRYFDAALGDAILDALGAAGDADPAHEVAAALFLTGVAESVPERAGADSRMNRVRVYGTGEAFGRLVSSSGEMACPAPQEALINEAVARRLSLKPGDDLILRIPKASQMPAEAPLAARRERDAAVARVRVIDILPDARGGRFSLAAEQAMPANVYVDLQWLGELVGLAGKANLLLAGEDFRDETLQAALNEGWRPDQAGLRWRTHPSGVVQLESDRLFLEEAVVRAALEAGPGQPQLTYLVNHIGLGTRATPYSFVVAGAAPPDTPEGAVCIHQWLADRLGASVGSSLNLSWYVPLPSGDFTERGTEAPVHKILPMEAMTVERDLAPHFPGLTNVNSCRDWDIGLPLDEAQLEDKENEAYWKAFGQTPKLLTTFETGSAWWGGLYGSVTAVRFSEGVLTEEGSSRALRSCLRPQDLGLAFLPVRDASLQAVEEAVDFGALFGGMGLFLIGAALILLALLYAHGLQTRTAEMGTVLASGWPPGRMRAWLLSESLPGIVIGAVAGAAGGVVYARMLLYGLARFWPDAVAGTPVRHHAVPPALLAQGMLMTAACVLAVFAVGVLRAGRLPIRELLHRDFSAPAVVRRGVDRLFGAAALAVAALAVWALYRAFLGESRDLTPYFFLSGAALLAVFWFTIAVFLGYWRRRPAPLRPRLWKISLSRLARRRSRTLGVAVVAGAGIFMIQSVVSMQAAMNFPVEQRDSGTGGFSVFAETTLPVKPDGGKILGVPESAVVPLRVRDGDDAGCLNLNRAREPRIYGVDPDALAERGAFAAPEEAEALWALLRQPLEEGIFPALVGDADTALWGLQAETDPIHGTEYIYQDDKGQSVRLRAVGKLPMRLSLFQGSLLVSEAHFMRLFPNEGGYRAFLIEATQAVETADGLERQYGRLGMEAAPSEDRLRGFYAVERAYLTMFLILGALGMMLGAGGAVVIVLRSLAERRAEFALLLAIGFTPKAIRRASMAENAGLLGLGLLSGSLASGIAALPLFLQARHTFDYGSLSVVLATILLTYLVAVLVATRLFLARIPLDALRKE